MSVSSVMSACPVALLEASVITDTGTAREFAGVHRERCPDQRAADSQHGDVEGGAALHQPGDMRRVGTVGHPQRFVAVDDVSVGDHVAHLVEDPSRAERLLRAVGQLGFDGHHADEIVAADVGEQRWRRRRSGRDRQMDRGDACRIDLGDVVCHQEAGQPGDEESDDCRQGACDSARTERRRGPSIHEETLWLFSTAGSPWSVAAAERSGVRW